MSGKLISKLVSIGMLSFFLSGCSHFFVDHSDDYLYGSKNAVTLQIPEGSLKSRNDLPIPNSNEVGNIDSSKRFIVPRAQFLFHKMDKILVRIHPDRITFYVPSSVEKTKKIVKNFIMAFHSNGESIQKETSNQIVCLPFQFVQQSWWDLFYRSIMRDFPENYILSFKFTSSESHTLLDIQYRTQDKNPGVWMSPTANRTICTNVIHLWGYMGRQLNKMSVYLSKCRSAISRVWIDHRGILALHLDEKDSLQHSLSLDDQLKNAGLKLVEGKKRIISILTSSDFKQTSPNFNKLKKVSLDGEYKYKIIRQKAGSFLVINTDSLQDPCLTRFFLMQSFIK